MNSSRNPVCSICIANYNGAEVIVPCIQSVYDQDAGIPIEIIVHDDASTDDSIGIIQRSFPDVKVIRSTRNVGFCLANNRMVKEAQGKFLLLLNNDAVLHRDALRTLLQHSESKPIEGILTLPQYDISTGKLIDRGEMLDIFLNPVPNTDTQRQDVAMVIGACLWISKNLWEELGGFLEWFENLAEDMYLCCVARLRGYTVSVVSCSGYDHWAGMSFGGGKLDGNAMRTTYRRRALSERNKTYVMFLYYPAPIFHIVFPVHILFLLIEGIFLSIVKRETRVLKDIYLTPLLSAWRNRKRLRELRRDVQKNRCISLKDMLAVHTMMPYKLLMILRHGIPHIK